DGIRDFHVTGVQTCALPISHYVAFTLNRQSGLNLNNMDEVPLIEVCVGGHYYLYILLRQGQVRARRRYSTGTSSSVRDFQTDWIDRQRVVEGRSGEVD